MWNIQFICHTHCNYLPRPLCLVVVHITCLLYMTEASNHVFCIPVGKCFNLRCIDSLHPHGNPMAPSSFKVWVVVLNCSHICWIHLQCIFQLQSALHVPNFEAIVLGVTVYRLISTLRSYAALTLLVLFSPLSSPSDGCLSRVVCLSCCSSSLPIVL